MTGKSALRLGITRPISKNQKLGLDLDEKLLSEYLKELQYENFLLGKPFPIVVDLEDMLNGFKLIQSLATSNDMVIPGHDRLVKNFFPKEGTSGFVWRLDKGPTSPINI